MNKKTVKIWIWLHNEKLMKAVFCPEDGSLTVFDEQDNILLKRKGLTAAQMKTLENTLSATGAKRIDERKEPFTIL